MRYCFYILFASVIAFTSCKNNKALSEKSSASDSKSKLNEKQQIDFKYTFYNAGKEKILGNLELAANLYAQCLRIDPNSAAALYELANICVFKGNIRDAMPLIRRAIQIEPENTWYNLLLADCYNKNKQPLEAAKVYQNLIKLYPERLDFYEEIAASQIYAGKLEDAIKTYDKLEEMVGINESIVLQKVNIYKELNAIDKVIKEMNKLIEAYPTEAKYYGILGELYQEKGMKEKAFENYQKLKEMDPDNGFVHLSLAEYYRANKEQEKSFSEMKLAFQNTNIDIDTKVKILLSYYYTATDTQITKLSQARELCKMLTETYPNDAKSYSVYGDFLYRDKQVKEAREEYRKAITLDKSKYVLWNQLLIIDSELNDFESMYKESSEVMELFPNQPLSYLLKAAAGIQMKKYNEAVETLKQGIIYVVDNNPLLSQFYATMGDAYNKVPDNKASDEAYEKALSIDSNNVFVLNNYAYYLSLRKDKLDKAEKMSKRSNELAPNNDSYQDTYGWILYQSGKYEEAKKWIEKALESGGKNSAVIIEHYGDIIYKLGDPEKAFKLWKEAKEKGTGSEFLEKKILEKKLYE